MKRFFFSLCMALFAISAVADTIEINNFFQPETTGYDGQS